MTNKSEKKLIIITFCFTFDKRLCADLSVTFVLKILSLMREFEKIFK